MMVDLSNVEVDTSFFVGRDVTLILNNSQIYSDVDLIVFGTGKKDLNLKI